MSIIVESECPACGGTVKFETVGEKVCGCEEWIAELTVNWKENTEYKEQ